MLCVRQRRQRGCSLSDAAETLEACIIDAAVNRCLLWPAVTAGSVNPNKEEDFGGALMKEPDWQEAPFF